MQKAKEKIAEQAEGSKTPQIGGFDPENSISTSSSISTAPQEVLDSRGATPLAVAKDSSRSAEGKEEEEKDDDAANVDGHAPVVPNAPSSSSSSTTAVTTTLSNTMDMMTYEVVGEYATVDSTVVEEDREVVADSYSSYDDGKGTSEEEREEKQKGDPDSVA